LLPASIRWHGKPSQNGHGSLLRKVQRMQLVEQHVISPRDGRFAVIDQAAFAAKNLYNLANYLVRQAFI
jgi:hypothetical protein